MNRMQEKSQLNIGNEYIEDKYVKFNVKILKSKTTIKKFCSIRSLQLVAVMCYKTVVHCPLFF